MNKSRIIIIASIVIVVGITATSILTYNAISGNIDKRPDKDDQEISAEEDNAWMEREPDYEDELIYEEIETTLGNNDGRIMNEIEAETIALKLKDYVVKGEYNEAEDFFVSMSDEYNLEGSDHYKNIVMPLRNDIPGLAQINHLLSYEEDEAAFEVVSGFMHPNNFLAGQIGRASCRERV